MECRHVSQVRTVEPHSKGCEDCLKIGGRWVHFHATKHPIVTSFEPGEDWSWCYVDQMEVDL
jgi:hypothetical protein